LKSCRHELTRRTAKLTASYHAIKIYAREVGFHASPPSMFGFVSEDPNQQSWYFSPARHQTLIDCLNATTEYLDQILSLVSDEILSLTMPDLIRLLYAVLVLARFATKLDAPFLDQGPLRAKEKFNHYLSALPARLQFVSKEIHNPLGRNLCRLVGMLEEIHQWYSAPRDLVESQRRHLVCASSGMADDPCVDIFVDDDDCPDLNSVFEVQATPADSVEKYLVEWATAAA
jgi:hypothetical protein